MEETRKAVLIRRVILSLREKKGVLGGEAQARDSRVHGSEPGQVKSRAPGRGEAGASPCSQALAQAQWVVDGKLHPREL